MNASTDVKHIVIIDDHPLFRDALATATSLCGFECVTASFGTVDEAKYANQNKQIDLILLDLNLKETLGLNSLLDVQTQIPNVPVAIVTANEEAKIMERAIALGACGFVPKSSGIEDLKNAITHMLHGKVWKPNSIMVTDEDNEQIQIANKLSTLTPSQRKVLSGLKSGLLNKQIAYEMGISEATVKAHLTAIFRKLGVINRTQVLLSLQNMDS